ncbi:Osmotin, thaumatin-like protein [Fomitiporia mediterranea MF3/22]|uniref:Osmotin, thaumatin-like protein n=1 Tax=Fomitiporia mediterranea (strain MF3/22) TaxID=694068 RepID=UPI0004408992|nr:Osmotin, thaumatin-like protein [Fomitiporia mediterranea MF3/22]EJD01942.1 Osmotin, thaumatin-like protein [Fomitiporia mediterranea MF3/22]
MNGLVILSALAASASARTFTVTNACPYTIWPAGLQMFTDMRISKSAPSQPTGWQADPNTTVSFTVPDDWKAGRIWGRSNCSFSVNPGPTSCATGGCNGGLLCDATTGTGVPPVSVAEWTLQGDQNQDFYDVSLVDGSNIPMRIDNTVGCPVADCLIDLNPNCPDPLKGPLDSKGVPLGCKSACFANLDGNQANSPNCCSGQFDKPQTCPNSGVAFYSYFKGNCPNAYAYAFDESSKTALWTCDSGKKADYTLTFCPSNTTTAMRSTNSSISHATASSSPSKSVGNPTIVNTMIQHGTSSVMVLVALFTGVVLLLAPWTS